MPNPRYFISDFVDIQRQSFFQLLEKGIIEEFTKRNPITSLKKDIELFFYPEHYKLTIPEFSPRQAIIKSKSYTSKLYIPVQLTYKKSNIIRLKWAYIGNLPLMTKRGHFILNGAARVIVNQIIRSPGIYYQEKLHETFSQKWSQKPETSYKRYYADLICLRGTWLRLEIDKDKNIWAQTKKGPKIPVFWFLIAMGLSERVIFNSVLEPNRLVRNLFGFLTEKQPIGLASSTTKKRSDISLEGFPISPPAVGTFSEGFTPPLRGGDISKTKYSNVDGSIFAKGAYGNVENVNLKNSMESLSETERLQILSYGGESLPFDDLKKKKSERILTKTVETNVKKLDSQFKISRPLESLSPTKSNNTIRSLGSKNNYCYVKNPPSAWKEIFMLLQKKNFINENMNTFNSNLNIDTTTSSYAYGGKFDSNDSLISNKKIKRTNINEINESYSPFFFSFNSVKEKKNKPAGAAGSV